MFARVYRLALVGVATVLTALAVAAIAIASSSKTVGRAAAPASTVVMVSAGPPLRSPPPGVTRQADGLAFFPRVVTISAGQSVTFTIAGFHTVTFGNPRSFPTIVPSSKKQPPLPDASGRPLWWAGMAPLLSINPRAVPEIGGGTVTSPSQVHSSGLLRLLTASQKNPPKPYTLTFSKAGTYRFFCIIHPGMHGAVRVLPSTANAPAAAQAATRSKAELTKVIGDLKRIQSAVPTDKLTVWVGAGKVDGAEVTSFFPKRLVVSSGDTVKFVEHDPTDIHTVTFGPTAYAGQIEKTFISPKLAVNPFGGFPSEPPGQVDPVQYTGQNHGNGYLNAGILYPFGVPKTQHVFRVTFTNPGEYHFECVIHSNMDGTIVVQ